MYPYEGLHTLLPRFLHLLQALSLHRHILNPELEASITCGGGIDSGEILVTKVGKGRDKNNNDLVWIGKADNYASHLSNEANGTIIISTNSYNALSDEGKTTGLSHS